MPGGRYEELHAKIAPRNFSSRTSQMLSTIKDAVEQRSFLNVQEVRLATAKRARRG